jgi:transposase
VVIEVRPGFDAALLRDVVNGADGACAVTAHGLPIYVALEPIDMRRGAERLGALVRERMRAEPRSRALFVFVDKRGGAVVVAGGSDGSCGSGTRRTGA